MRSDSWQNFLLICTVNHSGERENGSKGGKAMRAMSKSLHGDAAKLGRASRDDAVKKGV